MKGIGKGLVLMAAAGMTACADEDRQGAGATMDRLETVERVMDPGKGRELFIAKGCVICHSVNGVGGKAAPVLDAPIGGIAADPLDFAARIWLGAPAMIELQSVELGYAITLTGDEIGHLAAFAADVSEQKKLTIEAVPEPMRGAFLDERFWEVEDWDEFLRRGQEGYGEPPEEREGPDGEP